MICCMMPVMAQKNNEMTPKEMREMKKKTELLNSRANTYTEKLDSITGTNYRELISYDERLNCTEIDIYSPDDMGGWDLYTVYDYEFDAQDLLVSTILTEIIDGEEYCNRTTFGYDDQERLIEETYWNKDGDTWVGSYKMTFEYNAQGNPAKKNMYYFDENYGWFYYYYWEYNYENPNEIECIAYTWNYTTQFFEPFGGREIWYYDNQLCTLYENYYWDYTNSIWTRSSRIEYSYFDNGNLQEETLWFDYVPEQSTRIQYEYDSHNNNTLTNHYTYVEEEWVLGQQNEMEYDINVPNTNVAGLVFRLGGFYNDKILKERDNYLDKDIEEFEFHYSSTTNVGEVSESLLSIWPNPANETLNLKGNMTQVQIYSVDGRLVMSLEKGFETINVSALAAGSYLLKATLNDGSVATQKFVKR